LSYTLFHPVLCRTNYFNFNTTFSSFRDRMFRSLRIFNIIVERDY